MLHLPGREEAEHHQLRHRKHHPVSPENEIFTMEFINQFYDDDANGKYKGREAARDELDRRIDKAIADRRIR